jgi:hypothetical protein
MTNVSSPDIPKTSDIAFPFRERPVSIHKSIHFYSDLLWASQIRPPSISNIGQEFLF